MLSMNRFDLFEKLRKVISIFEDRNDYELNFIGFKIKSVMLKNSSCFLKIIYGTINNT